MSSPKGIVLIIAEETARVEHILESVPFMAGTEIKTRFLNTYKLSYADIRRLNVSEETWEQYDQIPASKLLKLSISLGNLLEAFKNEKVSVETRLARLKLSKKPQTADPFDEGFSASKLTLLPIYYLNLARNLAVILRNFDIGTQIAPLKQLQRHLSHLLVYSKNDTDDAATINSVGTPAERVISASSKSPIKLNSRQMLIEKLEINIQLDAMFTMKIVLKILMELFLTLGQPWSNKEIGEEDLVPQPPNTSASSLFSVATGGSDSLSSQDYVNLVLSIFTQINAGIVGPFTSLLQTKVVEPRVIGGFQNLLSTM